MNSWLLKLGRVRIDIGLFFLHLVRVLVVHRHWLAPASVLLLFSAGCGFPPRVSAGGSTFIDPIMQKWAAVYRKTNGTEIDYIKKGSGYGIQQMTERNIAFGCTDAPMSRLELEKANQLGGPVVHIPLVMAAIAVVYHLPEVDSPLRLTGPLLADIFLRRITRWNDAAISEVNPGVALPDAAIVVLTRAEASGTTYAFTEYLSKVSPEFPSTMVSKKPRWPDGVIGQEGNFGVTSHVKANPYCISCVEIDYARKNGLSTALIRNRAGRFVAPEPENVTAAADAITSAETPSSRSGLDEQLKLTYSLTDAPGPNSYPIPSLTYAVIYRRLPVSTGPAVVSFLTWVLEHGQDYAPALHYAILPPGLVKRASAELDLVVCE